MLLQPIDDPFDNFVVSDYGEASTVFDRKKKTIHIHERVGSNCRYDTWCAFTKDYEADAPTLKIVKRKKVET